MGAVCNDPSMSLRVSILTREYPPHIYGGAGVHVGQLVPQLRKFTESVDVQCMGEPREGATAHAEDYPAGANAACSASASSSSPSVGASGTRAMVMARCGSTGLGLWRR